MSGMRQAPCVECSLEVGLACWRTAHSISLLAVAWCPSVVPNDKTANFESPLVCKSVSIDIRETGRFFALHLSVSRSRGCVLQVRLTVQTRQENEGRPCRFHSCGRTETRGQDPARPDGERSTSPNVCSQARDDFLCVNRDSRPFFNFCISKRSLFVPGRVQSRAVVKAFDQAVEQTRSVFMGQAKYFKFKRFQRGRHGVPQGSRSKKNTSLPQDQTIRQSPAGDRPSSDAASRDRSRSHAYPRCGSMFHICRAYSRIVRSDEKLPMPATLAMAHAAQAPLWRYSA